MKSPMRQLIDKLEKKYYYVEDKEFWLELEKEELINFWVDGNKHGFAMDTDDPKVAERLYDNKFTNS